MSSTKKSSSAKGGPSQGKENVKNRFATGKNYESSESGSFGSESGSDSSYIMESQRGMEQNIIDLWKGSSDKFLTYNINNVLTKKESVKSTQSRSSSTKDTKKNKSTNAKKTRIQMLEDHIEYSISTKFTFPPNKHQTEKVKPAKAKENDVALQKFVKEKINYIVSNVDQYFVQEANKANDALMAAKKEKGGKAKGKKTEVEKAKNKIKMIEEMKSDNNVLTFLINTQIAIFIANYKHKFDDDIEKQGKFFDEFKNEIYQPLENYKNVELDTNSPFKVMSRKILEQKEYFEGGYIKRKQQKNTRDRRKRKSMRPRTTCRKRRNRSKG